MTICKPDWVSAFIIRSPGPTPRMRLVVNAEVARGKLAGASGDDGAFYQGKLAAARWYARNVPGIGLSRRLVEAASCSAPPGRT